MDISKIRNNLSSNDINILRQSQKYINEKIKSEIDRSSKAETRATSTLTFSGVLLGIIVIQLRSIIQGASLLSWKILSILYVATIIFSLKSAWFSFLALGCKKTYQLNESLIYDLQDISGINALKEEVAWKIWEYKELIRISNTRLYWVNGAQRNIFASMVTLSLFGGLWFLFVIINISIPIWVDYVFILITSIAVVFLDFIVLNFKSSIWNNTHTEER